ncbi:MULTISPECIES: TfuA-like protein [unclassified Frankia]
MPVVFLGPTLGIDDARAVLDAEFLPPVQLGDVWRISQERPPTIGIIDGYFHQVPAVWHKEILYALSLGIRVYGSSSMGALRGAELAPFGMVAVGDIAAGYCSGELTSDDEVALVHATSKHGFRPLSEPLVNVRATVAAATAQGVVSRMTGELVVQTARSLFYADRRWEHLLNLVPCPPEQLEALRAWLPQGRVDQKRADAVAMLERMRDDLMPSSSETTSPAATEFTPTVLWNEVVRQETPIASILDEFLLAVPLAHTVAEGIARASSGEWVDWVAILSAEPDWPECCRRARRKRQVWTQSTDDDQSNADKLLAWFFGERLGWPDDLGAFLRERAWTDVNRVTEVAAREAAFLAAR